MSWCGSHDTRITMATPWRHHGHHRHGNTSLSRCLVVSCQGLRQSLHTTRQRCDVLDRCMSFDLFERWRRHLFDMLEFKHWEVRQCLGLGSMGFLAFETSAKRFNSSSSCGVDFLLIIWSKPCKAKPEHQKRSHIPYTSIYHVFT